MRDDARAGLEQRLQLLLRRQEHALAHDVGLIVEEPVDRLEAQIRHPDEVRVRKREGDAQPIVVRLLHVAALTRQEISGAIALG